MKNSNKSFKKMITRMRRWMPGMAAFILVFVYLVSATSSGVLLSQLMVNIAGGVVLAFCIGGAIQFARAILVFFPQLNPSRPSFNYSGEAIAVVMGIISIAEIIALVLSTELAIEVAISLSILMGMGVIVEIFLLKEIRFSTETELIADNDALLQLRSFYQSRENFKAFLEDLDAIEAEKEATLLTAKEEKKAPKEQPQEELPKPIATKTEEAPLDLMAALSLNGNGSH